MSKFLQLIEDFDPTNDQNLDDVAYNFVNFLKSNDIKYGRVKSTNTFYVHDKEDMNKVFVVEVKDVVNTKPSEEDGEAEIAVNALADSGDPKAVEAVKRRNNALKGSATKAIAKYDNITKQAARNISSL
jgi:hypothetical protein